MECCDPNHSFGSARSAGVGDEPMVKRESPLEYVGCAGWISRRFGQSGDADHRTPKSFSMHHLGNPPGPGLTSNVFPRKSAVFPARWRPGFTLLELLIVISVMVILMGLLIPAFTNVRQNAKNKQREMERSVIESAIGLYKTQEKKFPAPVAHLGGGERLYYGEDEDGAPLSGGYNRVVMDLLMDVDPPLLDPDKLRWDADGNVIDPFGRQYRIRLDLDYSGFGAGYKVDYRVKRDRD